MIFRCPCKRPGSTKVAHDRSAATRHWMCERCKAEARARHKSIKVEEASLQIKLECLRLKWVLSVATCVAE